MRRVYRQSMSIRKTIFKVTVRVLCTIDKCVLFIKVYFESFVYIHVMGWTHNTAKAFRGGLVTISMWALKLCCVRAEVLYFFVPHT